LTPRLLDRYSAKLSEASLVRRPLWPAASLVTTTPNERTHRDFTDGVLEGADDDGLHARISELPDRGARRLYVAGYADGHNAYA